MIALDLLRGETERLSGAARTNVAFVPLGTPLLALPGAIAASMVFIRQAQHGDQRLGVALGLLGMLAALVWDGLPAHRSHAMRAWLGRQRSWLVVEPLPAYAPELNPVEPLWSNLKGVELANLAGASLDDVIAAAERGIQRIRDTHWLAFSFLRYCGLSLWWCWFCRCRAVQQAGGVLVPAGPSALAGGQRVGEHQGSGSSRGGKA